MERISDIIKKRLELEDQLEDLLKTYQAAKRATEIQLAQIKEKEATLRQGFDLEKIELAKTILFVHGNPYALTDDSHGDRNPIALEAIRDLLGGCKVLRREYFGNKRYERFYQSGTWSYFCGPTYGHVVDEVGLKESARKRALAPDEVEAAVYYLTIYNQLKDATK